VSAYRSANKRVFWPEYHVMWWPNYRRRVLVEVVGERLKEIIGQGELGGDVIEVEVTPGHVHVLVESGYEKQAG
jgi:REP element-mobilizing transposase RayT